tara:strand:+ start:1476 stop:1970 length:495 start_codon:yes stop_codon:yes gene_type:complete
MIIAIEKNLQKGIQLLNSISDETYADTSLGPYYASIGCHVRHVLDVYSCILKGVASKKIDLTARERNIEVELQTNLGVDYFYSVIEQLKNLHKNYDLSELLEVTDDLGLGNETATYTLGSILMQAQSHTTHHYASIGYLIYQLNVEMPVIDFGFNPSTKKKAKV